MLRASFATVSGGGFSFVPFRSSIAANSNSWVRCLHGAAVSSWILGSSREHDLKVPCGFLQRRRRCLVTCQVSSSSSFQCANRDCFGAIDAAMPMPLVSEDWPVQLGVWPAPSFHPYVFAALHAATLLFALQVVLLVSGRTSCASWGSLLGVSP